MAGGRDEPGTAVAKGVQVVRGRHEHVVSGVCTDELLDFELIAGLEAWLQRGMQMQHRHHGRGKRQLELDIKLRKDEHGVLGIGVTRGCVRRALV